MAVKYFVLFCQTQARIEGQDLQLWDLRVAQRLGALADFPLAAHEYQDIATAPTAGFFLLQKLLHRGNDLFVQVRIAVCGRPVVDIHRIRPAGHFDDRCIIEMPRELFQVNGGRGDEQLQTRAFGQ